MGKKKKYISDKKRQAKERQEEEKTVEEEISGAEMVVKDEPDAVRLHLKRFLGSSQFSDFIIRAEEIRVTEDEDKAEDKNVTKKVEFHVHKVIIAAQSDFFYKVVLPDRYLESHTNEIILKYVDTRAVDAMVNFMYDPSCPFVTGNYDEDISPSVLLARIYAAAEQYQVPRLKERVESEFKSSFPERWDSDDFCQVVEEVYHTTGSSVRGLRDEVVRVTREHINELLKKHSFQCLLKHKDNVEFAADMVQNLARSDFGLKSYHCPYCGTDWNSDLIRGRCYCMNCGDSSNF